MTALTGTIVFAGCDLEVVNPGPVADAFLDDPGAWPAVLTASRRSMTSALNVHITDAAVRARELHLTDVNDWNGFSFQAHIGEAVDDAPSYLSSWSSGQASRWIAEDLLVRMERVLGADFATNPVAANTQLQAGYANRLMGEYYCEAVFDGGPAEPGSAWFSRAEGHFTAAIATASAAGLASVAMAAQAGRASVRVHLGDWGGAVSDAQAVNVPTFMYQIAFATDADWRYFNALSESNGQTVWNTQFADYYTQTGDPRVRWVDNGIAPTTVIPWSSTGVPWYTQQKHIVDSSPVRLSSYQEMRLIEAEALLRNSDINGAMTIISGIRSAAGVADWPMPATLNDAWALLKRERGIELWLEGRRLADLKRWADTNTPGALDPHDLGSTNGGPDLTNRALCLPITRTERDRNLNLD
jgi:hypothetical protein